MDKDFRFGHEKRVRRSVARRLLAYDRYLHQCRESERETTNYKNEWTNREVLAIGIEGFDLMFHIGAPRMSSRLE
jgi:hypothetical protein